MDCGREVGRADLVPHPARAAGNRVGVVGDHGQHLGQEVVRSRRREQLRLVGLRQPLLGGEEGARQGRPRATAERDPGRDVGAERVELVDRLSEQVFERERATVRLVFERVAGRLEGDDIAFQADDLLPLFDRFLADPLEPLDPVVEEDDLVGCTPGWRAGCCRGGAGSPSGSPGREWTFAGRRGRVPPGPRPLRRPRPASWRRPRPSSSCRSRSCCWWRSGRARTGVAECAPLGPRGC